jgi:hypothetical protein
MEEDVNSSPETPRKWGWTGATATKGKKNFRKGEKLEICKPSKLKDDTDIQNRPFVKGGELNKDVTGASGEQCSPAYWDDKIGENRHVIKDSETDMVLSVPESNLRNVRGRNRRSFGCYTPSYRKSFDRIFGNKKKRRN